MINFRYHLVTVVAIFFALAVGIVLGAGPLTDSARGNMPSQPRSVAADEAGQRAQLATLRREVADGHGFAAAVEPRVVAGRLAGRSVAIVALPRATDALVSDVARSVREAGGTVTGSVLLTAQVEAPDQRALLVDLATRLAPAGSPAGRLDDPYARVGSVLAGALLAAPGSAGPGAGPARPVDAGVVGGLSQGGFLDVRGTLTARASAAVVVAPDSATGSAAADGGIAPLVALAGALRSGPVPDVVVGTAASAAKGGVVSAIRGDSDAAQHVSTVDAADTPIGSVATVYAVVQALQGRAGHYGSASAPDGVLPQLAGSPAAS